MANFSFEVISKDKKSFARAGIIHTRNGDIETPYLVPVATDASIKGISIKELELLGAQSVLVNTYHLHLQPINFFVSKRERQTNFDKIEEENLDLFIKNRGGIHKIMNFKKPIFSDSGGFQVFSLGSRKKHGVGKIGMFPGRLDFDESDSQEDSKLFFTKINEDGIWFRSVYDEKKEYFFNAQKSMEIQKNIGADIIMAFDECTSLGHSREYIKKSLERTNNWAIESLKHHDKNQAIYGIIQGGWFEDLRREATRFIKSQKFDGIAIGGSLGRTKEEMHNILEWVYSELEQDKRPRHLLGIGWIEDIFEAVSRGIDSFDCVEPTRLARHGSLYISPKSGGNIKNKFRIKISALKNSNEEPIDKYCCCETCKKYTRRELREMIKNKEKYEEYIHAATIHNLNFIFCLMNEIRESIKKGKFSEIKKEWLNDK